MTTISKIAKAAFDAANTAVAGIVSDATLTYSTNAAYNPATGSYSPTGTPITGGRALVQTDKPIADLFPDYIAGPTDILVLLEGFTVTPQEGWSLTFNSHTYEIKQVADILGASELFNVVAA